MPHVVVAGPIHPSGIALLDTADDVTYDLCDEPDEMNYARLMPGADALILRTQPLSASTIQSAPKLKIVSRHGVGYDAVDVPALTARQIPLAIVGDVNSGGVAEHAMMLMLAASKFARRADRSVRKGNWDWRNSLDATEITGKTLLIVGYGRIGQKLAGMAAAFDMEILAYDPFLFKAGWPDGPARPVETLENGLALADLVSIHMPRADTPIIGPRQLAAMKPTAVLVNTARGGIVDEVALARALAKGHIRAAGLDVFDEEPPRSDNPLLAMDNVLLSPHIAGMTREGAERLAVHSVRNVLDFFAGRLDPSLVVNGVPLNA
jgi:D-3-phosphoglycerate dehydrogenase / 2-oxoglutarate reductase